MKRFIGIIILISACAISVNAQYKMRVTLNNGTFSDYSVSEIKDISWYEYVEPITYEYVDLGLSVLWCTQNLVYYTQSHDHGDYFAWGEVSPYYTSCKPYRWENPSTSNGYSASSYSYIDKSDGKFTKYCSNSDYGHNNFTDGKSVLDPTDDPATICIGGQWHTPTAADFEELAMNCHWSWTTIDNQTGYLITSNIQGYTDKSIFLPAGGRFDNLSLCNKGCDGFYLTSSLSEDCKLAVFASFASDSYGSFIHTDRYSGATVRPVRSKNPEKVTYINAKINQPSPTKSAITQSGINWSKGDSIYIGNNNSFVKFDLVDGADSPNGHFVNYSSQLIFNDSEFVYGIHDLYDHIIMSPYWMSHQSYGSDYCPMYASSLNYNHEMTFEPIASFLDVCLTGSKVVSSIVLTTDEPIAGVLNISKDERPYIKSGVNHITLDCGSGVSLDAKTSTAFRFAIPEGTYHHLKIDVTFSDGSSYSMVTKDDFEVTTRANTLYKVSILIPDYLYVDLGLSVKWATRNLGASFPEDPGNYYAWGETSTKSVYDWSTYRHCVSASNRLTKYCSSRNYGYENYSDTLTTLLPSDDAASVLLGSEWRIPTKEEFDELLRCCSWTLTCSNGVYGYLVRSNINHYTDRSIFLPLAGDYYKSEFGDKNSYGFYWSSSLDIADPSGASILSTSRDIHKTSYSLRCFGVTIRPVHP